jgi:CxxC motif-containing protein
MHSEHLKSPINSSQIKLMRVQSKKPISNSTLNKLQINFPPKLTHLICTNIVNSTADMVSVDRSNFKGIVGRE